MAAAAAAPAAAGEAPMLLTRFLPITLYDRPVDRISDALRDFRNKVIYACAIEMAFCLFSLPLGALRGGVAKLSAGMNVILLIVAAIGLWAAAKLSLIWLLVHFTLIYGLMGIFVLYIFFTIAFGEGQADEGNWIILVVFAFVLVDAVVACFTARLAKMIHDEKKLLERAEEVRAARRAGEGVDGGGDDADQPPPVSAVATSASVSPVRLTVTADTGTTASGPGAAGKGDLPPSLASETPVVGVDATAAVVAADDIAGSECVVCLENPRDVLIYRCGHVAVCRSCGERLQRQGRPCPICRGPISDIVKVFG